MQSLLFKIELKFMSLTKTKKTLLVSVVLLLVTGFVIYFQQMQIVRLVLEMPPYTHETASTETIMLPMSDGVNLRTQVFLPKLKDQVEGTAGKLSEKWPIILIRYPYKKLGQIMPYICKLFNGYGYGCVAQLNRGMGESGGEWLPVVNEPNDGTDTLNWIAAQSWMDGNIAMWGGSYLAYNQWAAAYDYPEALKTFVPVSMGTNFQLSLYEKGAFRHFVTAWAMNMPGRDNEGGTGSGGTYLEALQHRPHVSMDEYFLGSEVDWYREWVGASSPSSPTWFREDGLKLAAVTKKLDMPILMLEGLYDPFFASQLADYLNLATKNKSRMIVGPWTHISNLTGELVPWDIDRLYKLALQLSLPWFEHHLKGKPLDNNGANEAGGFFKIYDVGANKWRTHSSWPVETVSKKFDLRNFSGANGCKGGELVLANLASVDSDVNNTPQEQSISYQYNPKDPVLSVGGAGFLMPVNDKMTAGIFEQEGFCERDDVLTFISEPIKQDMTISGKIKVQLKVASSAEDTAFTAKLMDVQPDGRAFNIRDSVTTLALRNDVPDPIIYKPGDKVDALIDMWATEWTIKKGHRLRLDISSSNFPAFNIHSNFAAPWGEQIETQVAAQTLYAPSYLELPTISH